MLELLISQPPSFHQQILTQKLICWVYLQVFGITPKILGRGTMYSKDSFQNNKISWALIFLFCLEAHSL